MNTHWFTARAFDIRLRKSHVHVCMFVLSHAHPKVAFACLCMRPISAEYVSSSMRVRVCACVCKRLKAAEIASSSLRTIVQNNQKSRRKYWALRSSIRSFAHTRTAHTSLLRSACFTRKLRCTHSFAHLLTHSLPSSWEKDLLDVS